MVKEKWIEKNGVIYLSVRSEGTSGAKQIKILMDKGIHVTEKAKSLLMSSKFNSEITNGKTYAVAVIRAWLFPSSDKINIKEMREEGERRGFSFINPEVAFLILNKFSKKELMEMPLSLIAVMSDDEKHLLSLNPYSLSCVDKYRKDSLLWASGFAFENVDSAESTEK